MSSFAILFIIAGITMAIPVIVIIVDSMLELAYHIRRALPTRTTHATLYARQAARGRL